LRAGNSASVFTMQSAPNAASSVANLKIVRNGNVLAHHSKPQTTVSLLLALDAWLDVVRLLKQHSANIKRLGVDLDHRHSRRRISIQKRVVDRCRTTVL